MILSSIIAHRGVSSLFPENTLIAVRAAEKFGIPWVEVDVQVLKDFTPVLLHDYDLARTTDASGVITDYTIDALSSINAGSWFDEKCKHEKIPTLHELLLLVEEFDMGLNLEIKFHRGIHDVAEKEHIAEIVRSIMRVIKLSPTPSRGILITSFYPPFLQEVRNHNASIGVGLLLVNTDEYDFKECARSLDAVSIHVSTRMLLEDYEKGARLLESIKKENLDVYCFTVNEEKEGERVFAMGVDGIFTDYPQNFTHYL